MLNGFTLDHSLGSPKEVLNGLPHDVALQASGEWIVEVDHVGFTVY